MLAYARLALGRTLSRTRGASTQTALSVAGIAVPVALMLLVTSVSVGLATGSGVGTGAVDYRVVPETGTSTAVTDVDAPQLGRVHATTARLRAREDVHAVTPVLVSLLDVERGGEETPVLFVGVVPSDRELVGLSTGALSTGDPHYANGSYGGPWTGEAVVSTAASESLGVEEGGTVALADRERSFTVVGVSRSRSVGLGQLPVAVVHLSELQSLTGATSSDSANQLLVSAEPSARPALEAVYPRTTVIERGGLVAATDEGLPRAIGLTAFAVAVAVGTLFVVTTVGFEVAADARRRAVLAAMGVSRRSRTVLLAVEVLSVSLVGGLAGIGLWLVGLVLVNAGATTLLSTAPVAPFHPLLGVYGLGVALLVGLLATPYLLVLGRRTTDLEGLR